MVKLASSLCIYCSESYEIDTYKLPAKPIGLSRQGLLPGRLQLPWPIEIDPARIRFAGIRLVPMTTLFLSGATVGLALPVVWRYQWSSLLGAALNLLLPSLGLASITFLLLVAHQLSRAFDRDLAGIDAVVGPTAARCLHLAVLRSARTLHRPGAAAHAESV